MLRRRFSQVNCTSCLRTDSELLNSGANDICFIPHPCAVSSEPHTVNLTSQNGERVARLEAPPAYPDLCIPPPPPDLDCRYVYDQGFRHITVLPPDPPKLDGNHDGVACEGG